MTEPSPELVHHRCEIDTAQLINASNGQPRFVYHPAVPAVHEFACLVDR